MLINTPHRSPWSNEYDPPLDDGTVPTPKLRKLEITANEAFDTYREMCVSAYHAIGYLVEREPQFTGTTKAVFRLCISGIWKTEGSRA